MDCMTLIGERTRAVRCRAWASWLAGALVGGALLTGCGSSGSRAEPPPPPPPPPPPTRVMPTGRLVQEVENGPLTHVSAQGWRTRIESGAITIQPPEATSLPGLQYVAWRMREQLGTQDLRAWDGTRRTLLLPGGAKLTMHGEAGEIMQVSLYDGAESHAVNVLTQAIVHSQVDAAVAQQREAAEADGESGSLAGFRGAELNSTVPIMRLQLGNLYLEAADAEGVPQRRVPAVRIFGRQEGVTGGLEVHYTPELLAPEPDQVCDNSMQPRGGLVRNGAGELEYTSRSGRWHVQVLGHTITVTWAGRATWQVWGDPHENLNGKHVKDWNGDRRTLLLDDGTKITMDAYGPHGVVNSISIYDGEQSHEIGNLGTVVRHSCVNAAVAATRDAEEADGETAYLVNLRGPASPTGYLYGENAYVESVGEVEIEEPVFAPVPLGETGDLDLNPKQVNDYYDDPRLGHT